jgi:hypothetical protein
LNYDPFEECNLNCEKMKCVCCGRNTWTIEGILLPYGSAYDQDLICDCCLIKIVDPYIKERGEKERRDEKFIESVE